MSQQTRNVAVGLTVIVALVILAGMIVLFTGLPEAFQTGYLLDMRLASTGNAQPGDPVFLSGIRVGRITHVGFADPNDPAAGVSIKARIESDVMLPGNTVAYVTKTMVGPPYVELKPEGPARPDPKTGKPLVFLPHDDKPVVVKGYVQGGDPIQQLRPAMESLARLADSIGELIGAAEPAADSTATAPARSKGLSDTINKLNRTLDSLETLIGDRKMREDIKTSMANLAEATKKAGQAMDALRSLVEQTRRTAAGADLKLEALTKKLIEAAEEVSVLMDTLNRIAMKIESGDGTAAKLLNDPQLYSNFEGAGAELERLLNDMDELVNEWRQKGIKLR